jgi:hypothetical protein
VIGGIQNSITTANTYIITNGNRVMFFWHNFIKCNLITEINSFVIPFSLLSALETFSSIIWHKLNTVLSLW